MNEVLKIEVQAQVQQAVAGMKQLQTQLKATDAAAASTAKTLPKLGQSSGQATNALTNFSRVVQDAPFGIIGIANNIDPLIQSFTALKASTGSTGAALKALVGGLIGGGGLALAVSAVTSAFTFFALSSRGANKELNESKNLTDGYVRSLTEQKLELQSLVALVKDAAQSEDTRNKALERLNQILPDSIGKLTRQNIVTAEGIQIIRQYTKAIEARATAELLINRLAENNVKLFDNRNKTLKVNADLEARIVELREKAERLRSRNQFEAAFTVEAEISAALSEQNKARESGRNLANEILKENELIRAQYQSQLPDAIKLNKTEVQRAAATKQVTEELKIQAAEIKAILERQQTNGLNINDAIPNFDKLIQKQKEFVASGLPERATRTSSIFLTPEQFSKEIQYFEELAKRQRELQEIQQVSSALANDIGNAFVDFFSNVSKDGKSAFEDLGKAIARTTQRILVQLAVTKLLQAVLNTIVPGSGFGFGQLRANGILRGGDINLSILRTLGG